MAVGVGVELGPSSIRAVVVERASLGRLRTAVPSGVEGRAARIKLLAAQEIPCDTSNADALTRPLAQLRRTLPVKTPIVLGVPSTTAIVATVTPLIPIPARSVLGVQFELQQHLPFELAEAVWHYQWLDGHAERDRSAIVGTMKRSLLEERLTCCRRAGLSVRAVAVNALATLNAWWRDPAHGGVEAATLLHLVSDQAAEWILLTPGVLRVVPVLSPSPEALVSELAGSWEALRATQEPPPQRVWVTGQASSWPKLQQALMTRGALQVERYAQAQVVTSGAAEVQQSPGTFVTAIGLALQGVGLGRLTLNLLHDIQGRNQVRTIRRVAMSTTALSVAASVGLGLAGMAELRHRRLQVLEALQRQERLYQTLRPDLRELLQRQQRLEHRIQQLGGLVGQGTVLTRLLAQTAELLPDDVWLTKLEYSKSGLPAAATASQADMLEGLLEGRAKSFQALTQFTDRLKGTVGIVAVKPLSTNVTTDEQTGKEVVAFAVQFQRLVSR